LVWRSRGNVLVAGRARSYKIGVHCHFEGFDDQGTLLGWEACSYYQAAIVIVEVGYFSLDVLLVGDLGVL
jgi:hypothetical protein